MRVAMADEKHIARLYEARLTVAHMGAAATVDDDQFIELMLVFSDVDFGVVAWIASAWSS